MILLDTSVLSRVLRRGKPSPSADPVRVQLERLLTENVSLALPGIVVQEILSGVRSTHQFIALRRRLTPFPIILAGTADHVEAARIVNRCRAGGVAAGTIDALIAALAIRRKAELLTLDRDFSRMAELVPLKLFGLAL